MTLLLFKCSAGHETSVDADDVMDQEGNPPSHLLCKQCERDTGAQVWAPFIQSFFKDHDPEL